LFVVADARALPVASASVDVLFGLNSIPAVAEARRVLGRTGELVLAYSFGDHTPVYLEPQEIADKLGKEWMGEAASGIWGQWARFWRH
jgi:ubiquinone/menaquinone biosynthesis C-methylase UbiE